MNAIFAVIVVSSLIQEYAALDLQNIQNANPLNIDLSIPSESSELVSNGDAEVDEHKLGGYRPLYPPYFLRDSAQQQQQPENLPQKTYYDKEYYTRGTQLAGFDDRLDRRLRIPAAAPTALSAPSGLRLVTAPAAASASASAVGNQRLEYARGIGSLPNYRLSTKYAKSGSFHVASSYTYTTGVRFPNT